MRKNNNKLLPFIIIIILIAVGYAYLSTNLFISGNTLFKQNNWSVYFDNTDVLEDSIELSSGDIAPTIDQDKTTVSYRVTYNAPGDYYRFMVDIVNDGTLNAQIDEIEVSDIPAELENIVDFKLEYTDGLEPVPGDVLLKGQTKTLIVTTGYKYDIDLDDIPNNDATLTMSITVTYKQKKTSEIKVATFDEGQVIGDKLTDMELDNQGYKIVNFARATTLKSGLTDDDIVSEENSPYPIYMWYELDEEYTKEEDYFDEEGYGFIFNYQDFKKIHVYWYTEADLVYFNEDSSSFFTTTTYLYIKDISSVATVDTSKITNMDSMFRAVWLYYNPYILKNYDTSNVESMHGTFSGAAIKNLNYLSGWNVSNVETTSGMFLSARGLIDISGISSWNVSNITNMREMFAESRKISDATCLSTWTLNANCDYYRIFYGTDIHTNDQMPTWYN